jgi:rubrerythrin
MTRSATVDELIRLAVQAERSTEILYRRLTRMFAHVVEIAQFIERYAAEESGHVIWLENLLGILSPEKLAAPAIPLIYQDALRISQNPLEKRLVEVETLDDVYNLMVEVANGEANQVLKALINTYYEDEKTRDFLQEHLSQHMQRISTKFPPQYATPKARQAVKAVREETD